MEPDAPGQEELHAFVDGELDRDATVKMAAKVAASPALAREIGRLRADKMLLSRVYGGIAEQPVPDRLLTPFRRRKARRRTTWFAGALAAAIALVAIFWVGPMILGGDRLVSEALAARSGTLSVDRQITAESLGSEAERDRLVADILSVPLKVPQLQQSGFVLSDITLFKEAAQISYRDGQGRLFTLYLRHPVGADRFDLLRKGAVEVCIWQNAELAVAMVGDLSAKEMLKLASATYADLNL